MEDDGAVKAPVTRLRRRLSVEQSDDVNSPAPATPTKKRGGRLAAKPQLELIDENASDTGSSKKSTRRAAVKDLVDANEEKPVTPSRRSTRIKSNTSIVSETSLAVDSPRAKRAARRLSQVGSDTETTVTSARKTRRTRKDSSSSIDKLDVTTTTISNNIADESEKNVINEEPELSSQKSNDTTKENTNTDNTSIRKSPRLLVKKQKGANDRQSIESSNNDNDFTVNNTFDDLNISKQKENLETSPKHEPVEISDQVNNSSKKSKLDLSDSSINIIQNLDKKSKKINSHLNKSTPALDNSYELIKNRHRTNSLTVMAQTNIGDGLFFSDNESSKKKKQRNSLELNKSVVHPGSGDNNATKQTLSSPGNEDLNLSREKKKRRDMIYNTYKSLTEKLITPEKTNVTIATNSLESQNISPEGNKENFDNISPNTHDNNPIKSLFEKPPSVVLQSTVYFEDSDSDNKEKGSHTPVDAEDQCVPVVDNQLKSENKSQIQSDNITDSNVISNNTSLLNKSTEPSCKNNSCEPMDIDETLPNNQSVNINNPDENDVNEQKILNSPLRHETSLNKSSNKSKRKSSLSTSQNMEKTENKSTLILSQIKDMSSTEKSVSESPKVSNEMLSKSVNAVEISKANATDKKKLSLDYSTSTPLQQKKFQKLGMQINTSIINTSNTETKKESKNKSMSKQDISKTSKNSDTSVTGEEESDSEQEEEESSKENNELLDDEAEVASDDYESGESQDEEERRYEEENEIVENGETLDSEENVSNDSDYDKDSFVVSSDEEDNDLLSGSGDDLSMSDNELTMSKKSKHKFDERKIKEQKKASREMYEARHKLDSSNKNTKQKSKKMKIDSSDDSDDNMMVRTKKNKNQRLDSTHDESLDKSVVNQSVSKKKSKRNQLSESSCDEAAAKEQEISVFDGNTTKSEDPLSAVVKQEPKTPVKELDISTVQINQNIEEVEVENNVSIAKTNQTLDPLQATMANDSEDSSMSENSEIAKNYDSVLNDLNNDSQKPKFKSHNVSLNLEKKSKQSTKEPIVDQLNLTQVKAKSKKNKTDADVDDSAPNKTLKKEKEQTISANNDNESSSDSIDLQLLFSDDSNNCPEVEETRKTKESKDQDEVVEDFIPLKRTPGKINILSSEGKKHTPKNKSLNESVSNKKQKLAVAEETTEIDCGDNDIKIIIDTQGSRGDDDNSFNISLNNSTKKKKNKDNFNVSLINDTQLHMTNETNDDDETPLEVSYKVSKNDKKNKESSKTNAFDVLSPNVSGINVLESSVCITESGKKKKKSKLSDSQTDIGILESSVCMPESEKKKKKHSESQKDTDAFESSVCIHESGKKKKKKLSESQTGDLESSVCVHENGKKKKNLSESQTGTDVLESSVCIHESGKKKKKKLSESQTDADDEVESLNVSVAKPGSHKKNKSLLEPQTFEGKDVEASAKQNISLSKSFGSAKKQKQNPTFETSVEGDVLELSTTKGSSKKKKKSLESQTSVQEPDADKVNINLSISSAKKLKYIVSESVDDTNTRETASVKKSKKRKRKSSANTVIENEDTALGTNDTADISQEVNISISLGSQKKKRKISQNETTQVQDSGDCDKSSGPMSKKEDAIDSKKCEADEAQRDLQTAGVQRKKSKKRKERDDDEGNKIAKVFKENSFDKVHVPRLPASILNQLEDKPKKEVLEMKKSTVISTSSFIVEETRKRKNKPSNYLEESVYLNNSYVEKKHKVNIKKPKVLPFVPTAVTSDSGFTTNFKINVIPQEVQFVAQTKNAANFKNDYLYGKKIKRLGTYEMYKKNRSAKMSKF